MRILLASIANKNTDASNNLNDSIGMMMVRKRVRKIFRPIMLIPSCVLGRTEITK